MKHRIAAIAVTAFALTAVVAPAAQAADAPHVARKARVVKSPPVVIGATPVKPEKERDLTFRKA